MFQEEDKGFNVGGELNGYIKLEINNLLMNINIVVYNIKSDMTYQVYIMKDTNKGIKCIDIGKLSVQKNIGCLSNKISPCSKDMINFDVAVVVSYNDSYTKVVAPVVAYKGKKINWREYLLGKSKKRVEQKNGCLGGKGCPLKHAMPCQMISNDWPLVKIPFNKEIFKRQVNINFAKCNPFLNRRKDYMWWSVTDLDKLYYFLKLFNIDIRDKILNPNDNMILGMYESNSTTYIVLGFLTDKMSDKRYDKIAKVADLNVRYGLIFINPYIA